MKQITQIVFDDIVTRKGSGACIYIPNSFAEKDIMIEIMDENNKAIQTIVTKLRPQKGTACYQYVPNKLLGQNVKVVVSQL